MARMASASATVASRPQKSTPATPCPTGAGPSAPGSGGAQWAGGGGSAAGRLGWRRTARGMARSPVRASIFAHEADVLVPVRVDDLLVAAARPRSSSSDGFTDESSSTKGSSSTSGKLSWRGPKRRSAEPADQAPSLEVRSLSMAGRRQGRRRHVAHAAAAMISSWWSTGH